MTPLTSLKQVELQSNQPQNMLIVWDVWVWYSLYESDEEDLKKISGEHLFVVFLVIAFFPFPQMVL